MAAQKLTKKDMKHDGFIDSTERGLEFLQHNAMPLGIGLLVIVALIVGVTYMKQAKAHSRDRASYLLYQGETLLSNGEAELAQSPLQECVERYGGTTFGRFARVGLAKSLLAQGSYEAALANADAALGEVPAGSPAARGLKQARAAAFASLGRYDEAASAYGELIPDARNDAETYDLSVRQAECLKAAGKLQDAVMVLEDLDAKVVRGDLEGVSKTDLDTRLAMMRALEG